MKKRFIVAATVSLYAAILGITWVIGTRQAREKTEAMLDYAVSDIRITMDGVIDAMLDHLAVSCVRHFGRASVHTLEEMELVSKIFDIDELNIVDRDGRIIATNDPDCLGVDMNLKDATRPYSVLTNGVTRVVSQPFRRHAYGNSRRKYLGVPFPGGDGYIQVGLDESRMEKMIPSQLAFLFDAEMEKTVCYLCANVKTGQLVSKQLEEGDLQTLDEIGFDLTKAPGADDHLHDEEAIGRGKTFEENLFGHRAFCRSYVFGGHRFIMIEPESEFFGTRDVIVGAMTVLLAFVLGAFAVLLMRISGDSERIKAFYAAADEARAKEMDIAKTIQSSALPVGLPDIRYARIDASMTPARDVGGDFYDYFLLDSNHGAFLVADVSGKGITAALYMMTAKTLIKDALLSERDLSLAITRVNDDLSRHNPANMFLTAWIGVLDFETGRVEFVNAGHNPPITRRSDGSSSWIAEKSGPMLAFMEGVRYKSHTVELSPGDALFLYTDGVTEAMDPKGELFGDNRLMETFSVAPSSEPASLCSLVRLSVAAFVAGAPAADDLTVLAVEYVSRPNRRVRSFPPTQEGVSAASAFLDEVFSDDEPLVAQLSPLAPALHVILDEIASNVIKHSKASGFEVDVEFVSDPVGVKLTFIDDGVPYDPLSHVDPDITLAAGERPIGGLGLLMVKKMSDSTSYERNYNRNFFSVIKNAPRSSNA